MRRILIDITRTTTLERNIKDELWPELVLAITYIKKNRLTRALTNNLSPYKAHFCKKPNFSHMQILGSTVYILLYKKERTIKSEKWALRVSKRTLISFDGHIIYMVHIKD